jgi:hypothetical protein
MRSLCWHEGSVFKRGTNFAKLGLRSLRKVGRNGIVHVFESGLWKHKFKSLVKT